MSQYSTRPLRLSTVIAAIIVVPIHLGGYDKMFGAIPPAKLLLAPASNDGLKGSVPCTHGPPPLPTLTSSGTACVALVPLQLSNVVLD